MFGVPKLNKEKLNYLDSIRELLWLFNFHLLVKNYLLLVKMTRTPWLCMIGKLIESLLVHLFVERRLLVELGEMRISL
jgi:hypothetical protein